MTKALSITQARAGLRYALEQKGKDYVYPKKAHGGKCWYRKDSQPQCIMGYMFDYLGIKITKEFEDKGLSYVLNYYFPKTSDRLNTALSETQYAQDMGKSWGEAYGLFNKLIKESAVKKS